MRHYTAMNYRNDDGTRTAVRVSAGGRVEATLFGDTGQVLRKADRGISRNEATRLVQSAFELANRLPERNGDMRITIGSPEGERAWDLSVYDLPHAGLVFDDHMRRLAADTLAPPAQRRGPSDRSLTAVRLIGWAVVSSVTAVVSVAIPGSVGLSVATILPDTWILGLAIELLAMLVPLAAFTMIGREFGERYRGEANVAWPVLLGVAPVLYVAVAHASGYSILLCVMALAAVAAQRSGYSLRPGTPVRAWDHSFTINRW